MRYSVVVPVYNVATYLRECLDSILSQETKEDFEVILVDDGSTDESGVICDEYAQMYKPVHVIHQANKGLPGARNSGLKQARGEYIFFVDSDDFWEKGVFRTIEKEVHGEVDVVFFREQLLYEDGTIEAQPHTFVFEGKISGLEYLKRALKYNMRLNPTVHYCMYRRLFLAEHNLWFQEGLFCAEDVEFFYHYLPLVQSMQIIDTPLYTYRVLRPGSITAKLSANRNPLVLEIAARNYRRAPIEALAVRYCLYALGIADYTSKEEAAQAIAIAEKNQDILKSVIRGKAKIIAMSYRIFGFYYGAKIMVFLIYKTHSVRKFLHRLVRE